MKDVVQMLPPKAAGQSMADLRDAFRRIGLTAVGYKESFESFRQGQFPCIVQLSAPDHFVVAAGSLKANVLVFDGSGIRRRVREELVKRRWTGNVLRVGRAAAFVPLPRFRQRNTTSGPCIQFNTLHIDKGDVPIRRSTVSFVYNLSNLGSGPLVVEDVQTDCGCLEVEKPQKPVPPNGHAEILLKYSAQSAKHTGVFHHVAVVKSNDPTYPLLPLHASGNTDARVTFSPRTIDFGDIAEGHPAVAYCFVHYTGENVDSFRLTRVRSSSAEVVCEEVSVVEYERTVGLQYIGQTASSNRSRIIRLACAPPPSSGQTRTVSAELRFQTSVEDVGTITVSVTGVQVPPVMVIPGVFNFGELQGRSGRTATASVVLRSRDERHFRVLDVQAQPNAGPFEFSLNEVDGAVTLKLVCDERAVLASHKSILRVRLQMDGSEEPFSLPVTVYAWPDFKGDAPRSDVNGVFTPSGALRNSGMGACDGSAKRQRAAVPESAPQ